MPFEGELASVWWCPPPAPGEMVPDYPPTELTGYVAGVSEPGLSRPAAPAHGGTDAILATDLGSDTHVDRKE